jgi:hypothetical protein
MRRRKGQWRRRNEKGLSRAEGREGEEVGRRKKVNKRKEGRKMTGKEREQDK